MLDIKLRTATGAIIFGASALLLACGDDGDSDTTPVGTATASASFTGTATGTAPTATTPATGGTSTASATPSTSASGIPNSCTTMVNAGASGEEVGIPGVNGAYSFGDEGYATYCLDVSTADVCLAGSTQIANEANEYKPWGAGIGLTLALGEGATQTAWNATAAGIAGFKYTLSGVTTDTPVRLQAQMVNVHGGGASDFDFNGFKTAADIKTSGEKTVMFTEFKLPTWTALDVEEDGTIDKTYPFDPSKLAAIQFQAAAGAKAFNFDFCIGSFTWIDAAGQPIPADQIPVLVPPTETDGGVVDTDGGTVETDGGVVETDGGVVETDGGVVETDSGVVVEGDASVAPVSDAGDAG
jgi:hypothetical protein